MLESAGKSVREISWHRQDAILVPSECLWEHGYRKGEGAFLKLLLSLQIKAPRDDNGRSDGRTVRVCCKHSSAVFTRSFIIPISFITYINSRGQRI